MALTPWEPQFERMENNIKEMMKILTAGTYNFAEQVYQQPPPTTTSVKPLRRISTPFPSNINDYELLKADSSVSLRRSPYLIPSTTFGPPPPSTSPPPTATPTTISIVKPTPSPKPEFLRLKAVQSVSTIDPIPLIKPTLPISNDNENISCYSVPIIRNRTRHVTFAKQYSIIRRIRRCLNVVSQAAALII